jgi:hypothetical protein
MRNDSRRPDFLKAKAALPAPFADLPQASDAKPGLYAVKTDFVR